MSCMIFDVEGFVVGYSKILPPSHNYTSEFHNHAGFDKFDITKLQSRPQADLFGTDLMELKTLSYEVVQDGLLDELMELEVLKSCGDL